MVTFAEWHPQVQLHSKVSQYLNGLFSIFHVMVPATQTMMLQTQTKQTLCDAPHSLITVTVLPGKKEEKEPLSWGRLISGAEVWVDLQSKQQ